jgi:hypothetical protein
MAGFWIRVNARLADDPEVRSFARALFPAMPVWLSVHTSCGLLVTLWGRVIDEQEDGRLTDRDDDVLEEWAKWRGDPGAFAALVRSTFLDDAGVLKEWDTYAGPLIRRRERDRVRKRGDPEEIPHADRAEVASIPRGGRAESGPLGAEGGGRVTPSSSGNGNGNVNEQKTDRAPRLHSGALGSLAGAGGISRQHLVEALGDRIAAVDEFISVREPANWGRWYVEMLKIVGPATGILPEDLARACEHALLAEPPVRNAKALQAFAIDLRDGRRRGAAPVSSARRTGAVRPAAPQYDSSANGAALRRLDREGVTDAEDDA